MPKNEEKNELLEEDEDQEEEAVHPEYAKL